MSSWLSYQPPGDRDPVELGPGKPFRLLRRYQGLLSGKGEWGGSKTPGQVGQTLTATMTGTRMVTLTVLIMTVDHADMWAQRDRLARALWTAPSKPDQQPARGLLRLHRPGMPVVETEAVPVDSPRGEIWHAPDLLEVTIELACPDPRWRETIDAVVVLESGGGFTFPLAHPWSSLSANVEAEIENTGSASAPVVARLYGEYTNPRLINVITGERIAVSGAVAAGEHVLIDTGFARKSVTLVRADGVEETWLGRVDLNASTFWHLPPGLSIVRFEADSNVSGRAALAWRPRLAGV